MSLLDMTYSQALVAVRTSRSLQLEEPLGTSKLTWYISNGALRFEYKGTSWNYTVAPPVEDAPIRATVVAALANHLKSCTDSAERVIQNINNLFILVKPGTQLQLELIEVVP